MKTFVLFSAAVLWNVVTGQDLACDGSCVATWKKCAGEGIDSSTMRPCCSEDDHCVEKTSGYSQCRPKAQAIPASWPSGAILTCTEPSTSCDPTAIVAVMGGLSAWRKTDNYNHDLQLDGFFYGDLDYMDTTCRQECHDNEDCVAFDETADGDCTLFGKDLFTRAGSLQPFFDAEVFLTKCFLPEPLCDPATREVRRINPVTAPGGGFHQMDAYSDTREFGVSPSGYALTAAINACRLQRTRGLGGCIGFALEDNVVTLLYNAGPGTTDYRGDLADNPQVYSIEECP